MVLRSSAGITRSGETLQNSAILRRSSSGIGWIGAAQKHIGRDADGAQFLDRMLGRLGLQLARGLDIGQQRQMHETGMFAAELVAELADGLEERQALDIADRAADLAEQEIDIVAAGHARIP